MIKSAYIHIPFCKKKCKYCSFVSFPSLKLKHDYIKALLEQIKSEYKGEYLKTLYIGGGTPSLLELKDFKEIFAEFNILPDCEITVELNPESTTVELLAGLKMLGVNRLSIGAQSFNDKILKLIGRAHNSNQIKSALNCARAAGFKNVSIDLIYGLPSQKIEDFLSSLETAINLNVEHISLYGLKIEEGCYFYKFPPINVADLDLQADMFEAAVKFLKQNDFIHYEVSNFCKKGCESKHNLNYWKNQFYYGFGCSASGYFDTNIRYTNQSDLNKYITSPLEKELEIELSQKEILEEEIFLGLRTLEGINFREINEKFGIDFFEKYANILNKYKEYFQISGDKLAFSEEGILISNEILAEFIEL